MAMAAVARVGSRLLRLDSNSFSAKVEKSRRSFSADHGHGPAKVNMWEQPGNPGNWKEEHFVFVSLAGWGALFFGGYKAATGGSKKKAPAAKSHPKPDPKPVAKKPESHKKAAAKPPAKPESKPAPAKLEPPKKADSSKKPPPKKAEPASKKHPEGKDKESHH